MRILILSDSHDNIASIERIKEALKQEQFECILHAGDYVAPFSVKSLLAGLEDVPFIGVFGNNDGEVKGLLSVSRNQIHPAPHTFELDGKRFFMTHDILQEDYDELISTYDVIVHGHTHSPEITNEEIALIINPGESCGWVTRSSSYAILDTLTMECVIKYA